MSTTAKTPLDRRHRMGMPFPPDKRQRVTQTTVPPWCATGWIGATFPDGTTDESTGFAIGDRYVVTAAHAVYDADLGGSATAVNFVPARDADEPPPYGTFAATRWPVLAAYEKEDLARDDFSLLVLANPMPAAVLHYRLTIADDSTLRSGEWQIAGYPDDKLPENSLWYAAGAIASVDQRLLEYRISTSGGQSGAALANCRPTAGLEAVGIHCRVNKERTANMAVRVTQQVIDQIESWKTP